MKLIVVGGFLGAGKTTLLAEAARRLAAKGHKVGLVSNDQAPNLVDTALFAGADAAVEEIAGSCFCCNFNGFAKAVDALAVQGADYVLAEPVGSCTDLAATIVRPMQKERPQYELAPLSVLLDADRVMEALGERGSKVDPDALYILRKQMEEADRLIVGKADRLEAPQRLELLESLRTSFGAMPIDFLSSVKGEGIEEWLGEMLRKTAPGDRSIEVDYDRYAHGEAVLGWLNASFRFGLDLSEAEATDLVSKLVRGIGERAERKGQEIAHVKALLAFGAQAAVANLTRLGGEVQVRTIAAPVDPGTLVLNARVQTSPEEMEAMALEALDEAAQGVEKPERIALRSLSPGRPVPTFRLPVLS